MLIVEPNIGWFSTAMGQTDNDYFVNGWHEANTTLFVPDSCQDDPKYPIGGFCWVSFKEPEITKPSTFEGQTMSNCNQVYFGMFAVHVQWFIILKDYHSLLNTIYEHD